jgi:hypothetical protein
MGRARNHRRRSRRCIPRQGSRKVFDSSAHLRIQRNFRHNRRPTHRRSKRRHRTACRRAARRRRRPVGSQPLWRILRPPDSAPGSFLHSQFLSRRRCSTRRHRWARLCETRLRTPPTGLPRATTRSEPVDACCIHDARSEAARRSVLAAPIDAMRISRAFPRAWLTLRAPVPRCSGHTDDLAKPSALVPATDLALRLLASRRGCVPGVPVGGRPPG